MGLFDRIKPTYSLRVWARNADGQIARPSLLGPKDSFTINDERSRPILRITFHGRDGVEIIQLAPFAAFSPKDLRRWADFVESENRGT